MRGGRGKEGKKKISIESCCGGEGEGVEWVF